jgi:hypothetical protein
MLVLAIGLPVLLAVVVAAVALLTDDGTPPAPLTPDAQAPLALPAVPAPAAGSAHCRALMDRLPGELASAGQRLARRTLADPAPAGTAAWGGGQAGGRDPVLLRCGIDRPAELTRTAPLLDVSGVRWLRLTGDGSSTWIAVDRPVYVALTFTDEAGTGPLQDISAAITATLPAQRVEPTGP